MTQGNTDIKQILNELFQEQEPQQPLSAKELAAWESGELSEGEKQALRKRLVMDRDGVRQLLEQNPSANPETPSPAEAMASWRQFEHKLAALEAEQTTIEPSEAEMVPFPEAQLRPEKSPLLYRFYALAASAMLVIILPLSMRYSSVIKQLAELKSPTLNPSVAFVYLGDQVTRADVSQEENPDKINTFSNGKLILEMKLAPNWDDLSPWHVTIFDPSGNQVFHVLAEAEERVIRLGLEQSFFSVSGIHTVEVKGFQGDEERHKDTLIIELP